MVFDKLLYSKKFIALMLFLLYLTILYITLNYSFEGIIYGTVICIVILVFFLVYAHRHVSRREVYGLLFFTSLVLITGVLTGTVIAGFNNPGLVMYSLVLTLSIVLLLLVFGKLYRF